MAAKNKPIYEFFCKGMMNRKHKGIRFDENGNVVCEPNAEFGADVEVDGTLTINSAKDLVTKDGTSLGSNPYFEITYAGGDEGYSLSAEECTKIKNGYDIIVNDEGVDGKYKFFNIGYVSFGETTIYAFTVSIGFTGLIGGVAIISGDTGSFIFSEIDIPNVLKIKTNDELIPFADDDSGAHVYVNSINGIKVLDTGGPKDIKVQATLYRHTIDIAAGGLGLHTYVTALSEKNTVIDSIQDLVTVFGNTKLMATGAHGTDNEATVLLEVGTSLTDTYVHTNHGTKMSLSNWANCGPDENYLVITDSVTAV